MNTEYLEYFIAVAETGSINQAANRLFISPQGLSRAIRQLESQLNAELFERQGGGMVLTPAGEKTLEYASEILSEEGRMVSDLHKMSMDNDGSILTISSAQIISSVCLPQILNQYFKNPSHTRIKILEHNSSLPDYFLAKDVDIVLISTPREALKEVLEETGEDYEYHELSRAYVKAMVSARSQLSRKKEISTQEFAQAQKVYFGSAEELSEMAGLDSSEPMLQTNDYSLLRSVLSANPSAVTFTDDILNHFLKDSHFYSLDLPEPVEIIYAYLLRKGKENSFHISEFVKILCSAFKGL